MLFDYTVAAMQIPTRKKLVKSVDASYRGLPNNLEISALGLYKVTW